MSVTCIYRKTDICMIDNIYIQKHIFDMKSKCKQQLRMQ